jgi:hypothetical protein
MKILGLLIFVISFKLSAQTIIENAPLSVETEPGRQMVRGSEATIPMSSSTSQSTSSNSSSSNSGSSVVVEKKSKKKKSEVVKEEKIEELKKEDGKRSEIKKEVDSDYATEADKPAIQNQKRVEKVVIIHDNEMDVDQDLHKYFQVSYAMINSNWKKFDPAFKKESSSTEYKILADMTEHVQFGLSMTLIHQKGVEDNPGNIRALYYKLFTDYHRSIFRDRLDWIAGLALAVGDYNIPNVKSGSLIGGIPSVGIRFYLFGQNSLDVVTEYHAYFSRPARYMGGFALAPRFSFVF